MTSRVVRATELKRILDVLEARGLKPPCCDLLPGGAVRLHLSAPAAANDAVAVDAEAEERAWAEVLAR